MHFTAAGTAAGVVLFELAQKWGKSMANFSGFVFPQTIATALLGDDTISLLPTKEGRKVSELGKLKQTNYKFSPPAHTSYLRR